MHRKGGILERHSTNTQNTALNVYKFKNIFWLKQVKECLLVIIKIESILSIINPKVIMRILFISNIYGEERKEFIGIICM